MSNLLEIRNLTVDFKGFVAIDSLSLNITEHRICTIIGPNGAGKSTLIDLITGKIRPTSGVIKYHGRQISGKNASEISNLGIGRKFQGPNVFQGLTVYENLELALMQHTTILKSIFYKQTPQIREQIERVLRQINLWEKRDYNVANLSHGEKQWVEIGMVIIQDPELVILDEPTTGMTEEETFQTGEIIKEMQLSRTVIVSEHDMDFVRQVAQDVNVLHQGKVLAQGTFEEIERNPKVISVYLKDESKEAV